ncbi:MAG: hypothetical protein D6784_02335 [Chloroflexi bacterium]|nr:MAG: hypothetical protein D6784_02335 [Chloroflexota bacterium]
MYTARLSGYVIIYLNLQAPDDLPFFQETAIRQALMMGLDRQAIIDEALNGQGVVARGPIHPWSWAYNPDVSLPGYNPDQAARLLDEAGWRDTNGDGIRDRDGQPLAFTLLSSDAPERVAVAEAVSRQWASIGVEARVEATAAGLADRLNRRDFQAALAEVLLAGDPDPYPFWHLSQAKEGQNFAGWTNDEASLLLEEARRVTNRGKRNDAYFEFQRIFAEEIPSIILYYPVYTFGVSREVHGVQVAPMTTPGDRFRSLPNWYMLTRRVIFSEAPFPEASTPTPAK